MAGMDFNEKYNNLSTAQERLSREQDELHYKVGIMAERQAKDEARLSDMRRKLEGNGQPGVISKISAVESQLGALNEKLNQEANSVCALKGDMKELRRDVTKVSTDVASLGTTVERIDGSVKQLSLNRGSDAKDITAVKTIVEGLKVDVKEIGGNVARIDKDTTATGTVMQWVKTIVLPLITGLLGYFLNSIIGKATN
jgi:outer membrane murein-binding lipoprotein Lpp